ncbi:MAG TPA: glycoside hydrolase family 15 protein, partial [Thermodesulfobacteriota bacterium]|nr:glycoside hydrolase family 15 protein [Thermodesulfobacteriota bacterium]
MTTRSSEDGYPPLRDYGYIADCHSSALVSKSGSIDWCCMPRVDSRSCFGRILGWNRGGYWQIAPSDSYSVSRRYLEDTLVLETTFYVSSGEARLIDCFPMRRGGKHAPHQQILRIVEGVKGKVEFAIKIVPRFDYGAIKPWIRQYGEGHHIAIGGSDGLLISGDVHLHMEGRHDLFGTETVGEGRRIRLSLLYRRPEELDKDLIEPPSTEELDRRLEETVNWWKTWSARGKIDGHYAKEVKRSAIVLKGLSNAPTGAIAAAPTSSLPEAPGGGRNWDYRFTWIRDSCFTVRSLVELGYGKEADGFRRFIERSAAGSAEEIQVLFGVGGERRLHEQEVKELEGYRGAKPVRIGNAAETQTQLDVYGELLDLAWQWHTLGNSPDNDYWEFLVELVGAAARLWKEPDRGIWEMRGEPRHFVYSKAMCWAALDRGIKLAEELGLEAPVDTWKKVWTEISSTIEEKGYDARRGVFTQAFGRAEMDAALLLLPIVGFVDHRDERMVRTTDAIREDLEEDGLLRRYRPGSEGMEGTEGVFLACSFWLVECLAFQERVEEAHRVFKRVLAAGNDLGLFSEEYDTKTGEILGNFPHGLTHLSLITATVALSRIEE